ncbi:MAG: hypothetical protein ACM4AI_21720 [Acidobacteriota bacterium]
MRGGQNVFMRIFAVALVCALPVSVGAQQAPPQPQSQPQTGASDPQLERIKNEVRTFEIVLFRSIETAGQKLAAWAQTKVPNVLLSPAADPVVNGFPTADSNLVFMIRISELSGVAVFTTGYKFFPTQPTIPSSPETATGAARPVSTAGQTPPGDARADRKVTSTTVVADDPMKNDPPNPDAMYSDLVRLGLMDAMLDSSSVLQSLRNDQWLTVVAIPVDVLVTNPYYRNTSRKLILSIKGEDLAAFRAGKITRDEAKQRIVDTRF